MSQQDYFIEFARELGALNGNIKSVLSRLEKGDEKMAGGSGDALPEERAQSAHGYSHRRRHYHAPGIKQ